MTTIGAGPTLVDLVSFNAVAYFDKVRVTWATDSEIDNAGFNIYRSEDPENGYIQVNPVLIVGLGDSSVGQAYPEYHDPLECYCQGCH